MPLFPFARALARLVALLALLFAPVVHPVRSAPAPAPTSVSGPLPILIFGPPNIVMAPSSTTTTLPVHVTTTTVPTTRPVSTIPSTSSTSTSTTQPSPTTTSTTAPPVPSSPQPIGDPGTWHLIFDDELNGTTLDTSKWSPYWFADGDVSNNTPMYSANVAEGGGNLILSLTATNTGGLVSTNGKFSYTYGFAEARIFLPTSQGVVANWPAFWADGQVWPQDGEMDILEGLSGKGCWHFITSAGNPGGCPSGNYGGWHTFAADWEQGKVSYYYDGVDVGSLSTVTGQPMYVILENSDGSYGLQPPLRPTTMLVDYVRVWQH